MPSVPKEGSSGEPGSVHELRQVFPFGVRPFGRPRTDRLELL